MGWDPLTPRGQAPVRSHPWGQPFLPPDSRVASRADAGLGGFLLHDGRDDGRVWDAGGVQPVGGWRDHVWGETAGHQTAVEGAGGEGSSVPRRHPRTSFPPQTLLRTSWVKRPPAPTQLGSGFPLDPAPACRMAAWTQPKRCSEPMGRCFPAPPTPRITSGDHLHPPQGIFGGGGHCSPLGLGCAHAEWGVLGSTHRCRCCRAESHIVLREAAKTPVPALGTPKEGPLSLPRPTWTWRRSWRGRGRGAESHQEGWSTRAALACKCRSFSGKNIPPHFPGALGPLPGRLPSH